jgi:glucose/arabinose dehydrogenase
MPARRRAGRPHAAPRFYKPGAAPSAARASPDARSGMRVAGPRVMHRTNRNIALAVAAAAGLALPGCYFMRGNSGGGRDSGERVRRYDPADVLVPDGYAVTLVAQGLAFPTGIAFDDSGRAYVLESGWSPPGHPSVPQLLRLEPDGRRTVVAQGRSEDGPWNGVAAHGGSFFVAEAGSTNGGRILEITRDGSVRELAKDLPGFGDHSVNGPAIGPDGAVYFGIGTATNSGVVGEDNKKFGWLEKHPTFCEIPGQDIVLTGRNFTTDDLLAGSGSGRGKVETGAFVPFGTATTPGQRVAGKVPCTGGVMKITGLGAMELVAWGFRNPFGLAFAPDGRLFVTDNGYDERGSRPVWGSGELLWEVRAGTWYGWPDFAGNRPLTDDEFDPPAGDEPTFLLAEHPNVPPRPAAVLACHASANGFDFSRNAAFGHVGEAFVALFGDQTPTTGDLLAPTGFKVVRVDVATGVVHEFAANAGSEVAPASKAETGGLERPIACRFDPSGTALWVVDFGILTEGTESWKPEPRTGCLWRIERRGTLPAEARR